MNINEYKKLKQEKKSKRTYYDRYNDAVTKGFSFKKDSIYKINDSIIIEFNDVILLSFNDLLRIHHAKTSKYKALWKERVNNILKNKGYNLDTPICIEILYINHKNKKLDYDASIACLKYIIDGLVKSEFIKDDTQEHVPLILSKTILDKNKEYDSIILCVREAKNINHYYSDNFNELIKIKST
tara:strand:- start:114584 stop:115135 length:552 start_codon:yes stop_codon:yes gene_type:complete